jgi:hypothetical protein
MRYAQRDRQSESMKEFADIKTHRKTNIFREREREKEERRKTDRERKTEQD